jgi:hypothetical protein
MAIQVLITCDKCGARVPRSSHSRIRWPKTEKRAPTDLCLDCADEMAEQMGLIAPRLPGMKPSELAKNDQAAAERN